MADTAALPKEKKRKKEGKKTRKYKRNRAKCLSYRNRVGKPNGRGMPGQHRH